MNWPAWSCLALGIGCALLAIRSGEESVARYGRRVTVTEMIPLGLKGDRRLLLGGLAGWAMALSFAAAAWFAF
ncbi:MAG: hypothetical protein ACK4FP_13735 [Azonexus sp.]